PSAPLSTEDDENDWIPIRSIYVARSVNAVIEGIKTFDYGKKATVEVNEPGLLSIRFVDSTLIIGIQSVNATKTGVHVAASGTATATIDARVGVAAQLEMLRDTIEAS